MIRRALVSFGASGAEDLEVHLDKVVAWCVWLQKHSPLELTLFWSSYASATGDQVLEESLALMEAHTHLILVGEQTSKLMIQQQHAVGVGVSVIDLTGVMTTAPVIGSPASQHLADVLTAVLNLPTTPARKGA